MSDEARRMWSELEAAIGDEVLSAALAAYAFVACSDGHLAEPEVERGLAWARTQSAFAAQEGATLERWLRALARMFELDFETGERRTERAIARVKGDDAARALVLGAAQVAMVADARLEPSEEAAMRRVCLTLGVDPDAF